MPLADVHPARQRRAATNLRAALMECLMHRREILRQTLCLAMARMLHRTRPIAVRGWMLARLLVLDAVLMGLRTLAGFLPLTMTLSVPLMHSLRPVPLIRFGLNR
jgi:hypothetical protein